jgi:predicted nicotinamide N-methyase
MAPPYWAFAWPGSEALARFVTDRLALVAGRHVLDFAAGCGLAAIAAARLGAASVAAAEIDPFARAAIASNAELNGVRIDIAPGDLVGAACRWEVILCGDVCYEPAMTAHILPWLRRCAEQALVLIGDPRRKYAPQAGHEVLETFEVPTSTELESGTVRQVDVLRLLPG